MAGEEAFSNPAAPADYQERREPVKMRQNPLTNDDFRKLLMTPRAPADAPETAKPDAEHSFSHRSAQPSSAAGGKQPKSAGRHVKKKKPPHIRPKKEEEDELSEIMKKYRDRAKERRLGDAKETCEVDLLQLQAGYRAVAHDSRSTMDAAERRKQMIQESKYLGGDMEHTHLVKGLDYSLLQKVRSEITSKEQEEEELEAVFHQRKGEREEVETQMKSGLAKSIYRVLFKDEAPKWNELFAPRRMAYVIDLDDECESDIPTTLIRSKTDCPVDETSTNLSTNDMVIQKLTQVLAYLRTDTKRRKKEGKGADGKPEADAAPVAKPEQNIYDDVGEYVPNLTPAAPNLSSKEKSRSYFDKEKDEEEEEGSSKRHRDRKREKEPEEKGRDRERERAKESSRHRDRAEKERDKDKEKDRDRRNKGEKQKGEAGTDPRLAQGWAPADLSLQHEKGLGYNPRALSKDDKEKGVGSVFKKEEDPFARKTEKSRGIKMGGVAPDSYAECYPGGLAALDAAVDSDEEADFLKMDLGNKKGPIRRWDFENQDDYEKYMSSREAMPKAAFQYGLKMNDGRKTRKTGTGRSEKDERHKIDREWQKISKILSKRKEGDAWREGPSEKHLKL